MEEADADLRVGLVAVAAAVRASAAATPFLPLAEEDRPVALRAVERLLFAALAVVLPPAALALPALWVLFDASAAPGAASISADAVISAASSCPLRRRNGGF
jgi:hypothetical protein